MLKIIEQIHKAGYVHNDLSLDNIVFGFDDSIKFLKADDYTTNFFRDKTLHLVDYTYMTPYEDLKSRKHLKQVKVQGIMLNLVNEMQSYRRLDSMRTSRRDDLEMFCNLLIFLSN